MAMDLTLLKQEATDAVADALAELYKEQTVDREALEGFAGAVAAAAVAAIAHVIARAETDPGGAGIR